MSLTIQLSPEAESRLREIALQERRSADAILNDLVLGRPDLPAPDPSIPDGARAREVYAVFDRVREIIAAHGAFPVSAYDKRWAYEDAD